MIKVRVRVQKPEPIKIRTAHASNNSVRVGVNETVIRVGDYEHYEGDYFVTPSFEQQRLQTKNKVMNSDVTVNSIQITRVSNPSGGKTVIIGG